MSSSVVRAHAIARRRGGRGLGGQTGMSDRSRDRSTDQKPEANSVDKGSVLQDTLTVRGGRRGA